MKLKLEFRPVVQEEMPFKDISYPELWLPFCSTEQNHICNLGIMKNNSVN